MRCPRLEELPPPPPGKTGWPWTEETPPPARRAPGAAGAWPRVSVVTPSYNQAQFIEETLRSVLLQGYPDLEYIVVDGGSTDGSVEIIRKYEPWLAHWVSEPDRGQSDAINKGWRRATGEVWAYLNSDDVYLRHALERAAVALAERPRAPLAYGGAVQIDERSEVEGYVGMPEFDLRELVRVNFIIQPSAFLRGRAVAACGYLNKSLHLCMDYDLWLRVALRGEAVALGEHLSAFRIHREAKTTTQLARMNAELADIAADFLAAPDLPAELRGVGRRLLARQRWAAGGMLWFGGQREEAGKYLRLASEDEFPSEHGEVAYSVASAAVRGAGGDAARALGEFFKAFPAARPAARLADAWACVLLAKESVGAASFYGRVWRALRHAPRPGIARAMAPLVLRRVVGARAQRGVQQLKRSLTHSPVGLPLSKIS